MLFFISRVFNRIDVNIRQLKPQLGSLYVSELGYQDTLEIIHSLKLSFYSISSEVSFYGV